MLVVVLSIILGQIMMLLLTHAAGVVMTGTSVEPACHRHRPACPPLATIFAIYFIGRGFCTGGWMNASC